MAEFSKQHLLSELIDRTELIISNTKSFQRLSNENLSMKPAPGKWSVAEIFQHLNITHEITIAKILPKMSNSPEVSSPTYKSSWLGDFIYEQVMPRPDGTVFKLKARKSMQPSGNSLDGQESLNQFLQQQDKIHDILQHASTKDIQRIKIPFCYTPLLNLNLGDNLRYLIAHNERHMLQAKRNLNLD